MSNAFAALCQAPADEIDLPPVLGMGTWNFRIASFKAVDAKDEDKPGKFLFALVPTAPQDDVNPSDAESFDPETAERVWYSQNMRDNRDAYRVRKFLEAAGVEISGRTLLQAAATSEGYEVSAYVDHEPSDDPTRPYVRLKDFGSIS